MFEFRLPDLGEGIHEGEILKWHVEVGGQVAEDAPLLDIETDKAAVTIPSPRAGTVRSRNGEPGDVIHTGDVLCVLDEYGEDEGQGRDSRPQTAVPTASPASPPTASPASDSAPSAPVLPLPASPRPDAPAPATHPGRGIPAAPATRRLARELGVELSAATPTGPAGRVMDEDVRRAASGVVPSPATSPAPEVPVTAPTFSRSAGPESQGTLAPRLDAAPIPLLDLSSLPDFAAFGPVRREPLRSIRRKTASRMVTSAILVPHVAHLDEIDVTDLEALRRAERTRRSGRPGEDLTLLSFVVKAVALGLREHPHFNASLDPVAEEIVFKEYVNVGVAVDSGRGLIVPVVREADRQSIVGIVEAVGDLGRRGRDGTLKVEDLRGGTFTITNIGFLGGTGLVPLVNYPEVAILGMARAQEKPVVRDGSIVVRTILPVTLAFDHRVADGADAARFVNDLKRRLENPMDLFLEA